MHAALLILMLATLWQPPPDMTLNYWVWGPGGKEGAPSAPFEFIEEDLNGTNPKIRVRDAKGDQYTVKFGGEDHTDVFTSRLLYALGYVVQPTYFVASGTVVGAQGLRRAKPFLDKHGAFTNACFKLRDHKKFQHVEDKVWSWNDNPFIGTRELNGLKIVMMLLSNWDAKDSRDGEGSNTSIYSRGSEGGLFYAFDDWGASLGKWGGFFERDKWNPEGFREQTKQFVRSSGQSIEWGYRGKHNIDITLGIRANDIRWLLIYLSRVTDDNLRVAFRSSGATEAQIESFTGSIRQRVQQLQHISEVLPK